jgi:hypothetical protein
MVDVKQKLETVILIPTRVKSIREEFKITTGFRHPTTNEFPAHKTSKGWFAAFEGSWEALYVGETKPEHLNVDDAVFIAIQKPHPVRR